MEAIFYPVAGDSEKLPTKETVLDESGKPKCVLIAVQAPFGSYTHMAPLRGSEEGAPERQLYVGNQAGLERYNVQAPPVGSKRQSPFAMTSGRAFKTARTDERGISVFVLPTFFDDKEQKLKTTGVRLLSDDAPPMATQPTAASVETKDVATGAEHAADSAVTGTVTSPPPPGEDLVGDDAAAVEESKRQRSSSWDVAESMANDEGVSEFFEGDAVV